MKRPYRYFLSLQRENALFQGGWALKRARLYSKFIVTRYEGMVHYTHKDKAHSVVSAYAKAETARVGWR